LAELGRISSVMKRILGVYERRGPGGRSNSSQVHQANATAATLSTYAEAGPEGWCSRPSGAAHPSQQLHPPGLDPGHPSRRGRGAPLPRPSPHRHHPGGRRRRQHPGADGADGPLPGVPSPRLRPCATST